MKLKDLDIVTSKRSGRSRPSCVVTFDPHLWLDPFAELWNLPAARTQTRLNASAPCPASQHVLDRERQGSAADAAIGAALARLSRQYLPRLARLDALPAASVSLPLFHPGADTARSLLLLSRRHLTVPDIAASTCSLSSAEFTLFFDGGSRENPGPGGAGAIVVKTDRLRGTPQLAWDAATSLAASITNNNRAGSASSLTDLAAAARKKWRLLKAVGDGLLIVRQMEQYHRPTTRASFSSTARHDTLRTISAWWCRHLRAYNKMADAAANVANE